MCLFSTRTAAGVAAISLLAVGPLPASAATDGPIKLKNIAFLTDHVDVTGGPKLVTLRWTVTNSTPGAEVMQGRLDIRLRAEPDGSPSIAYVGLSHEVRFFFGETYPGPGSARWVSGTLADSTYEYDFIVPRYANRRNATWSVSGFTVDDGPHGHVLTVEAGRLAEVKLTATSLVDATPPTHDELRLNQYGQPYLYVGGVDAYGRYDLRVSDYESTFWKGSVQLSGPSGQRLTGEFGVTTNFFGEQDCGGYSGGGAPEDWPCQVLVRLPAGTGAGAWKLVSVTLVDNAGNQATTTVDGPVVTATSNAVVSASGFTATPNPVNNWVQDVEVAIGMTVSGAQQGVAQILVTAGTFTSGCQQLSTTPTTGPDGRFTVPIRMRRGILDCDVHGIAIIDGAGNLALYGSTYNAPATQLSIRRMPNTTPPTATDVTLDPRTVPLSEAGSVVLTVTMKVQAPVAPVTSYALYIFNSADEQVHSQFGGVFAAPDGTLWLYIYRPGVGLGTYTIGFTLYDASGLHTSYGMPTGGEPMPGGPLQFSVVPD
ncbi:MAG TPA: hypothetical protein VFM54_23695 [Micromonosporaceae bacterium]|nr:hypothetical protein [Micromonosporaceae bacterium]